MKNGREFVYLFLVAIAAAAVSPGRSAAQTWPPGNLIYTHSNTRQPFGRCTLSIDRYYNWVYTDSTGVAHSFPGQSEVDHYIGSPASDCIGTDYFDLDTWSSDGAGYHLHAHAASGTVTVRGSIFPKFVILSVAYAPPGSASYVDYGTSQGMGTTNSWSNSFSSSTTLGVSFSAGFSPLPNGKIGGSVSQTWTETQENNGSIAIDKGSSNDLKFPGPANSDLGIDHDYDQILLWINPESDFYINGAHSATWNWSFDPRDPANEPDVIPLYVAWLKNPSTMPSGVAQSLARTWAGSGQGLTTADFNAILSADPFTNPSYQIDTTRFDLVGGSTFAYVPPACGGQPDTQSFNQTYKSTSTTGQSATDSYSITVMFSVGGDFGGWLTSNFTSSQMFTWTNKWSSQTSVIAGQTATVSITGPSDCMYTGGTDVQVYQDNVYGTFMFHFLN